MHITIGLRLSRVYTHRAYRLTLYMNSEHSSIFTYFPIGTQVRLRREISISSRKYSRSNWHFCRILIEFYRVSNLALGPDRVFIEFNRIPSDLYSVLFAAMWTRSFSCLISSVSDFIWFSIPVAFRLFSCRFIDFFFLVFPRRYFVHLWSFSMSTLYGSWRVCFFIDARCTVTSN